MSWVVASISSPSRRRGVSIEIIAGLQLQAGSGVEVQAVAPCWTFGRCITLASGEFGLLR